MRLALAPVLTLTALVAASCAPSTTADTRSADEAAIRESWAGLLGAHTAVSWRVTKVELAKSGDLGYLYGTYLLSIRSSKAPPVQDSGKIVEIWKKQADGKWKCIVDTYNSDMPAASAPQHK